jgi:hypothetical protein
MQFDQNRHAFMLGGAAAAWPLAARAQQPSLPMIGLLGATTAQGYAAHLASFRCGATIMAAIGVDRTLIF